jgi:transposase
LRALALLSQGKLPSEVAKLVGVDRRSVRRWKATIRKDGEKGLRARPASGRPPKLTAKDRRKLEDLLLNGPLAAGSVAICGLVRVWPS